LNIANLLIYTHCKKLTDCPCIDHFIGQHFHLYST
jgi:hypothetical protein